MGFRDEREAGVQRIEVLERELTASKHELEAALLRAAEVEDLRKRIVELTRERDELKRGIDASWAARNLRLRAMLGVVLIAVVGAGYLAYRDVRRREQNHIVELARAQGDATSAEAGSQSVRTQLAAAQQELAQIDAVHSAETAQLQHQLGTARMQETGRSLLLTMHIRSRSGEVPSGVGDECVMAIRTARGDAPSGICVATVWCGEQQVFPVIEPSPDLHCTAIGGAPWTARQALGTARAQVNASSPPLLAYDARTGTLDVRETGGPVFALQMHVDRVLPYLLR